MPHSHHSHSGQFCQHAKGTLEEVVVEAIRQNFYVYGLTEHVPRYREEDLYPEEAGTSLKLLEETFEAFLDEAHRLRVHYKRDISLLVGLETEYITPKDLDKLELLLTKHRDLGRIDYIVGSVHHVNEIPIDFDKATYEKAVASCSQNSDTSNSPPMERFLCRYFDQQFDIIKRFRPEVIGHIDLCRLYTPELEFKDFPNALQKLEKNIQFAVSYGALFELNAASFRKGWDAAYPGRDVVKLIQEHKGKFTLSDDSHGPQGVGLNYDKLEKYAQDVGISVIWYLCQSEEGGVFDRNVDAVETSAEKLSVHNRATINGPIPHHGDA